MAKSTSLFRKVTCFRFLLLSLLVCVIFLLVLVQFGGGGGAGGILSIFPSFSSSGDGDLTTAKSQYLDASVPFLLQAPASTPGGTEQFTFDERRQDVRRFYNDVRIPETGEKLLRRSTTDDLLDSNVLLLESRAASSPNSNAATFVQATTTTTAATSTTTVDPAAEDDVLEKLTPVPETTRKGSGHESVAPHSTIPPASPDDPAVFVLAVPLRHLDSNNMPQTLDAIAGWIRRHYCRYEVISSGNGTSTAPGFLIIALGLCSKNERDASLSHAAVKLAELSRQFDNIDNSATGDFSAVGIALMTAAAAASEKSGIELQRWFERRGATDSATFVKQAATTSPIFRVRGGNTMFVTCSTRQPPPKRANVAMASFARVAARDFATLRLRALKVVHARQHLRYGPMFEGELYFVLRHGTLASFQQIPPSDQESKQYRRLYRRQDMELDEATQWLPLLVQPRFGKFTRDTTQLSDRCPSGSRAAMHIPSVMRQSDWANVSTKKDSDDTTKKVNIGSNDDDGDSMNREYVSTERICTLLYMIDAAASYTMETDIFIHVFSRDEQWYRNVLFSNAATAATPVAASSKRRRRPPSARPSSTTTTDVPSSSSSSSGRRNRSNETAAAKSGISKVGSNSTNNNTSKATKNSNSADAFDSEPRTWVPTCINPATRQPFRPAFQSYSNGQIYLVVHDKKPLEHRHGLAWKPRKLMKSQLGLYSHYIYSEDDIGLRRDNLLYWCDFSGVAAKDGTWLGFVRYETSLPLGAGRALCSSDFGGPFVSARDIAGASARLRSSSAAAAGRYGSRKAGRFTYRTNPDYYSGFWITTAAELWRFSRSSWLFDMAITKPDTINVTMIREESAHFDGPPRRLPPTTEGIFLVDSSTWGNCIADAVLVPHLAGGYGWACKFYNKKALDDWKCGSLRWQWRKSSTSTRK